MKTTVIQDKPDVTDKRGKLTKYDQKPEQNGQIPNQVSKSSQPLKKKLYKYIYNIV